MKHVTLAVAIAALMAVPVLGDWTDDFQSYTVGSQISGQGGWAGWDGGSFTTAVVADDPGSPGTGNNVLQVVTSNNMVREVTGFTSGTWVFTAKQYIPSSAHANSSANSLAYLNLMNNYVSGGAKGYGVQLNYNLGTAAATSDTVTDPRSGGARPVVYNAWVDIRVEINLDSNFRAVYYNNVLLGVSNWYDPTDPNQAQSIAAVDLNMGANASVAAYYDNLSIAPGSPTTCPPEGTEDFQSYALGSAICGQCSWAGWDGAFFADAVAAVDPDPAAPPTNQVIEEHPNNDMVQQYWGYTSGAWVYRVRQYIPSSNHGKTNTSFILMNKYVVNGSKAWAVELNCDLTNDVVRDGQANEAAVPIVYDQWVDIRVEIDLDYNIRTTWYNNTQVGMSYWYDEFDPNGAKSIAAVDLWCDAGDPVYYDDISITPGTPFARPPGTDLTTTARGSVSSHYLVDLGQQYNGLNPGSYIGGNGSTIRPYCYIAQGLYDISNSGGNRNDPANNWNFWNKLNDGRYGAGGDMVTWNPIGPNGPDYVGYKFKLPATVRTVEFWNDTRFGDGGPFNATPEVQYLDTMNGTNWQTLSDVTWDKPYNTTFSGGVRRYVITLNSPPTAIWGLRLYGQGATNGASADADGFIGVTELTLYGDLEVGSLNTSSNLARDASATAIAFPANGTAFVNLIDGNLTTAFNTFKAANWDANAVPPQTDYYGTEDYLGVAWTTPQTNVAAMGVIFTGYRDGGWFGHFGGGSCTPGDTPFRIEYTTDANVAADARLVTWTPVTNLDYGRYLQDWRTIHLFPPWNWSCSTGFLFRFDPIPAGITGLRIIGHTGKVGADGDGFVGAYELEVFGNQ